MDLSKIHFTAISPVETLKERAQSTFLLAFTRESTEALPMSTTESELSEGVQPFAPRITSVDSYRNGQVSEAEFGRHFRLTIIPDFMQLARTLVVAFADAADMGLEDITLICNTPGKCQCQILVDMIAGYQAKHGAIPDPYNIW